MLVAATIESAVGKCLYLHLNAAEVMAIFRFYLPYTILDLYLVLLRLLALTAAGRSSPTSTSAIGVELT